MVENVKKDEAAQALADAIKRIETLEKMVDALFGMVDRNSSAINSLPPYLLPCK